MSPRSRTSLLIALGFAVCTIFAPVAMADLTFEAVGGTIEAHSWMQAFELKTDHAFDYVGLFLLPLPGDQGAGFKADAWDFSVLPNPNSFDQVGVGDGFFGTSWTVAAGDSTNTLRWLSHFKGDEEVQRFHLTLFTFNDGSDWQGATSMWDGKGWTFGIHTPDTAWQEFKDSGGIAAAVAVPIPSAALLGLLGFGLVGAIRRRLL